MVNKKRSKKQTVTPMLELQRKVRRGHAAIPAGQIIRPKNKRKKRIRKMVEKEINKQI